jgi:PAS domain S-box-containing protein
MAELMISGLIKSSIDPIIQINEEGTIKLVNQACLSIFNYQEEDLIGQNVKMLMPEQHAEKLSCLCLKNMQSNTIPSYVTIRI